MNCNNSTKLYFTPIKTILSALLILLLSVSQIHASPHIFNADSPVVLVQETEFATMPYHNNNGEVGTTLVVSKALGIAAQVLSYPADMTAPGK